MTQPNLISTIIDYYFIYGIQSSSDSCSTAADMNSAYSMNSTSNSKSVIDLICLIPNELCNKLFEKIVDFMNKFPMHQPQQQTQVQQQSPENYTNFFERVTNLLILICYRKKRWLDNLITHPLLNNVIKVLKVKKNIIPLSL